MLKELENSPNAAPEILRGRPVSAQRHDSLALETLRYEFSKRMEKNPQYSLRAFAKQLGVSHTLLSLILSGKRKPSAAMVERLAERLQFPSGKAASLLASVSGIPPRGPGAVARRKHERFTHDQFAVISEWQHYAILSLLEIPGTKFEPKYIAQRLGISLMLAKISLQRLMDLKIVAQGEDKQWRQVPGPIVVEKGSTEHGRKFQRQLMNKALESLDSDPKELRDFSSTTFAMHPKHVEYALARIREFRHQLSSELESFGDPEEVYNLTVQIFPTSKRSKK